MRTTRDISPGEIVLQESPVVAAVHGQTDPRLFLTLPERALEAILFLHDAFPDHRDLTKIKDIPHHRLMNALGGVLSTNAFEDEASYGIVGLLQLTGSLFNHEKNYNVTRRWNETTEQLVFTTLLHVRKGEELTVIYAADTSAYGF
jgi:hypothetical protein